MTGAPSTDSDNSHSSATVETLDVPISGSVLDLNFVDDDHHLVEVEDSDGSFWDETYEFVIAECAGDLPRADVEATGNS